MNNAQTKRTQAQDQIEVLISLGYGKAYDLHFPDRNPDALITRDRRPLVHHHCAILDSLGVSWEKQNHALMFLNDAASPKTWDCFYQNSFGTMAGKILDGATFNNLLNGKL